MRRLLLLSLLVVGVTLGGLGTPANDAAAKPASRSDFPQTVRVRLWYLHPPHELRVRASEGQAQLRTCPKCKDTLLTAVALRATGSLVQIDSATPGDDEVRVSGAYQMNAVGEPPIHSDCPIVVSATGGHLLITALMPMEEYIAGVLAGEVGNFKSDEALKAMSVAARTFAMHFGSRHALDGFDFCDSTHCQDLRLAGVDDHLRRIADSTAGEVLWYDGEPAATYYYANCGGTTENGRYILGNDEAPAPYLVQHSDRYCVRNGGSQWNSEISRSELQRALADDGINIPGRLRTVAVLHRTSSGRVELLRVSGSGSVMVSGLLFRTAVGRHIGWERLKSNWYDVSFHGDRIVFHGRGSGHGVGLCQIGAEVMGEEGHSYREILSFYYPGTRLGVAAQGLAWQQLANDDIDLLTTRPDRDRALLPVATRSMHDSEESTGLVFRAKPRLKVYATVAEFRNSTGEPGWVAASTRGRTIQMQPPDTLRDAGTLDGTIHHELLHMLIESYVRLGTPLWFREGLVLYLTAPNDAGPRVVKSDDTISLEKSLRTPQSEQELRHAYAEARERVSQLAKQYGKDALLGWVQDGLPTELTASVQQRAGGH
jgi:stage II sporulation protein D